MKHILAIFLSILMAFAMMPVTTAYAVGEVVVTVSTDKRTVTTGDTVEFTVSMGAVEDLGALQFYLDIPSGLSFVDGSAVLPERVKDVLNSDGEIVIPTDRNSYIWAYSAQTPGYSGTVTIEILKFSCTVNADIGAEDINMSLTLDGCYNFSDIADMSVKIIPAVIAAEELGNTHVHKGIQHYESVASTCIIAGNVEYWTCSGSECDGKYYGDAVCEKIFADIITPVNPDNHVRNGRWESDAEKHVLICACGAGIEEGAHVYDGDEGKECNVCGYQRIIEEKNENIATGHEEDDDSALPGYGQDAPDTATDSVGQVPADAATAKIPSSGKEPKTADSTPSVATLAMIGGMACLMDLLLNKRGMLGLSETQKNMLIHRIIDKAKAKNRSAKWFAMVLVAFILIYYHSIGKRVGVQMDERVQLS